MRKEPESAWFPALDRLKGSWSRTRRWVANQGPATRVGLIVGAMAVASLVGYLATGDHAPGAVPAVLFEGRRLSSDDLGAIASALDAESIPFRSDIAAGRVVVSADRKAAALEAIAKRKATPATLDGLNHDDEPESPWGATLAERERRERTRLEQSLKLQIEALDAPILSAQVRIHRDRARGSWNARWNVHAFVYLKIEGGRRLSLRTIEGIETFLVGAVPDLKAESITVADQTGHKYMAAGDVPLKEEVRKHSQEEEWSSRIAEGLRHIPGVGVSVTLESVAVPAPVVEPAPAPPAEAVTANRGLEVTQEPRPVAAPPAPPVTETRANVWVRVPRSFYLMAAQAQTSSRHPSAEDMEAMKKTTARIIREAVDASIPKHLQGEVKEAIVQDDLAASRTVLLPPESTDLTSFRPILVVALGVGLAVIVSVATALRFAVKRPALRPSNAWRPGFVADEPNPGPSERVRELIRLNPEAAAGVLQRWIGQGGAVG